MLFKPPGKYLFPGDIIRILTLDINSDLPGSVLVNASWYSGGLLHVDANACSSAEVAMAWSNNLWPVSKQSEDPVGEKKQVSRTEKNHINKRDFRYVLDTNQEEWQHPVQEWSRQHLQASHSLIHLLAVMKQQRFLPLITWQQHKFVSRQLTLPLVRGW